LHIPVHYNSKMISLIQDNERVVASFEGGRSVSGNFCIRADGINSSVRKTIFPDLNITKKDRQYFGVGALIPLSYLSDEEIALLRLQEGSMNVFTGQVGFVGLMGIGTPDEVGVPKFMFWSHIAKAHVADDFDCRNLTAVKDALLQLRGSWHDTIAKTINLMYQNLPNVEVFAAPVFSNHPLPRWSSDRVVLIGDAAHGYGPGASGAALALEDACYWRECWLDKELL
jgi:salicylate hydroxylase